MTAPGDHRGPPISVPQVSLQGALQAGLSIYSGHPTAGPMSETQFRRLLGLETTSGSLLRLTSALKMYGLIARTKRSTHLTSLALELYSTDDRAEFASLLQAAARRPQFVRDLGCDYATGLRPDEIERQLSDLGLSPQSRRAVLGLLLDTESFLKAEERSGDLFAQVQYAREHRPAVAAPVGLLGARHWFNTMPGRTANLTLVAVVFVGSLMYFAFSPGTSVRPTAAQVAHSVLAPTPEVSVPAVFTGMQAAPVATAGPEQTEPRALASNQEQRARPAAIAAAQATADVATAFGRTSVAAAPTRTTQLAAQRRSERASMPVPRAVQTPTASARVPAVSASAPPGSAKAPPPAQALPAPSPVLQTASVRAASVQAASGLPPLEHGRELTRLLYSQRLVGIWRAFSPAVRREWGDFSSFVDYRQGGLETFGAETGVVSEEVRNSGGVSYYTRTVTFERGPRKPWTVIFGFDQNGTVVAFNIVAAEVLPSVLAAARP